MKGTLVLLGDSFTHGDGSNSEYIMRECFSPEWISNANKLCLAYHVDPVAWADQHATVQSEYVQQLLRFGLKNCSDKHRWSSIFVQHTGLEVLNLGVPANSTNGILISLSQWLNNRQKSVEPVCVMANYTFHHRHSFVSRYDLYDNRLELRKNTEPHKLINCFDAFSGDMDEYFVRYNTLRGYEFDFYHTLWLCGVLCDAHDVSFVWSGPSEIPLSDLEPHANYLNFPVKHHRNISNIIPEFTDIIEYHRYCAQDCEKNPLSPCGHYNEHGQALMGRELSRKILENEDWLFDK